MGDLKPNKDVVTHRKILSVWTMDWFLDSCSRSEDEVVFRWGAEVTNHDRASQ